MVTGIMFHWAASWLWWAAHSRYKLSRSGNLVNDICGKHALPRKYGMWRHVQWRMQKNNNNSIWRVRQKWPDWNAENHESIFACSGLLLMHDKCSMQMAAARKIDEIWTKKKRAILMEWSMLSDLTIEQWTWSRYNCILMAADKNNYAHRVKWPSESSTNNTYPTQIHTRVRTERDYNRFRSRPWH